jgi:menaquinol-cytochrome c reductase iron-sulfur subunit
MPHPTEPDKTDRRDFLKKACCVAIGGAIGAAPIAAGVGLYLDPLQRGEGGSSKGIKVKVTTLDALPDDGVPRRFRVFADRVDAWTKTPAAAIGAVYLARTKDAAKPVMAFNSACPHLGCSVKFVDKLPEDPVEEPGFWCPCHNSSFKLDGAIARAGSPAARGLDELECSIENGKEVWVQYQNFQAGIPDKKPLGS